MKRPATAAILVIAGLVAGGAAPALAQSVLPLRGTVAEDVEGPPAPAPGALAATRLEVTPLEPPPSPPPRRAATDPYAPQGVGTGPLRLYPTITAGSVHTSNVNSSGGNPRSDTGLELKPGVRFESDWVRHSWTGGANASAIHYLESGDLDSQTLDIFSRLRLDIRRSTTLELSGSYALDQNGIGSSGVPATAKGLRTEHTFNGEAALTHDFARFQTRLRAGATAHLFEDVALTGGGTENNKDRDYLEPVLAIRAAYSDSQILRPYVEASYTPRLHNQTFDRFGLRRDSQGLGLAAGVEFSGDALWSGDLGVTYLHRDYDDPLLASVDAFGLTGSLTWNPSEITRVVMSAGTEINEVSSASRSANPVWTASVSLTHGLRDNVDLLAGAGIEIEDTGAAHDVTYDANFGLAWKLRPELTWTAGYDLTWLDSSTATRGYAEHRVSTGLTYSP